MNSGYENDIEDKDYQSESEERGYARTPWDRRRIERGKALTEALSFNARMQQEAMQRRRDEMYENMRAEAGEVESPKSRLH